MRTNLILFCFAFAIASTSSSSRSDTLADAPPADPIDEPITGQAATPAPGDESPMKDPFAPYDIGPPEAIWTYESLTTDEKVIVDRGRNQPGWDVIHDAYGQAAKELAARAAAESAASQLGAESLDTIGVVP